MIYILVWNCIKKYSEIPLLRPPKMETSYLFKTLFAKLKLVFSSFSTPSLHLIRDHLWDCPKVVFKTTFGQSQRWSYYRNLTVLLIMGLPKAVLKMLCLQSLPKSLKSKSAKSHNVAMRGPTNMENNYRPTFVFCANSIYTISKA